MKDMNILEKSPVWIPISTTDLSNEDIDKIAYKTVRIDPNLNGSGEWYISIADHRHIWHGFDAKGVMFLSREDNKYSRRIISL